MKFICADWGKEDKKRAAYVADSEVRTVRRVTPARSLQDLIDAADPDKGKAGGVVVAIDCALGAPRSLLGALGVPDFRQLLSESRSRGFFDASPTPKEWRPGNPFFAVPAGEGTLASFVRAAADHGVHLTRSIDDDTGGKSPFILSGFAGTVGSATRSLWQELSDVLATSEVSLWPFDGVDLDALLKDRVVVAEIYPRSAYATALRDGPPSVRPRLTLAKTVRATREQALDALRSCDWVAEYQVALHDTDDARSNEDCFDAFISAASLLRACLDGDPLYAPPAHPTTEGGILGTGSINLSLPEKRWSGRDKYYAAHGGTKDSLPGDMTFACPIPGCVKKFIGSRSGWDAHVESIRSHPDWRPSVSEKEERKRQFRLAYPSFFS